MVQATLCFLVLIPHVFCFQNLQPSPHRSLILSASSQEETPNLEQIRETVVREARDISQSLTMAAKTFFQSDNDFDVEEIIRTCDELDGISEPQRLSEVVHVKALEFKRYELLVKLLRKDYDGYVATASFLSPSRIPRLELPNIQDVPYDKDAEPLPSMEEDGVPLVPDCELDNVSYNDNVLDKVLLSLFRKSVEKNTGGVQSEKEGILGLLDQARIYMLQPNQTAEAQHKMVRDTLSDMMTPALPPFYRIFMAGIIPKSNQQIGPWFYAPFLTSFVTPYVFGFLVGPARTNRRKDGQPGGLVVEKCKFLQESGCKGMCLNICKLPAEQFFGDNLGVPLTVTPNFVTQECQWSFGESPLPVDEDPAIPKGCLVGCESRKAIVATGSTGAALCS